MENPLTTAELLYAYRLGRNRGVVVGVVLTTMAPKVWRHMKANKISIVKRNQNS